MPPQRSLEEVVNADSRKPTGALSVLASLFFIWGLITSLNDILVPQLKAAFSLDYVEAMLIQFCFFGAYFVMSFPSGYLVERRGYKQGIIVGLTVAGVGCLLFYPAAGERSYPLFLAALFVLASGITVLQVAANPYVTILGRPESASSRLNLTQAFNSLGTTIGPYLGSLFILAGAAAAASGAGGAAGAARASASVVQVPYLVLAAVLFLIAVIVGWSPLPARRVLESSAAVRRPVESGASASRGARGASAAGEQERRRSILRHRHLVLGAIGIFVYVGAEVSIGSLLVSFMGQREIAALPAATAGKYLSLYWGGAMLGRFVGSAIMLRIRPARLLAVNAGVGAVLVAIAVVSAGHVAMWALLAVGLFNSIMFPTIFALALDGLGERTGEGSGVLCMAIVGGALIPELQAWAADSIGLLHSFVVPIGCYLYILYYAARGHRRLPVSAG
ncbi:MAG: sugar MFS transporter [Steroidobacteraceae bacterium]